MLHPQSYSFHSRLERQQQAGGNRRPAVRTTEAHAAGSRPDEGCLEMCPEIERLRWAFRGQDATWATSRKLRLLSPTAHAPPHRSPTPTRGTDGRSSAACRPLRLTRSWKLPGTSVGSPTARPWRLRERQSRLVAGPACGSSSTAHHAESTECRSTAGRQPARASTAHCCARQRSYGRPQAISAQREFGQCVCVVKGGRPKPFKHSSLLPLLRLGRVLDAHGRPTDSMCAAAYAFAWDRLRCLRQDIAMQVRVVAALLSPSVPLPPFHSTFPTGTG